MADEPQSGEMALLSRISCCGQARDSNFCPVCGRQLREGMELQRLLLFLRNHEKQAKQRLETRHAFVLQRANGKPISGRAEAVLRRLTKTHDKWKGWADAVEEIMSAR